jgi:hypothetical protein
MTDRYLANENFPAAIVGTLRAAGGIGSRLLRVSFCSAWVDCRRKGYLPF